METQVISRPLPALTSDWVVQVDQTTEADWNALVPQFVDANIYQTWAYGAVCWGEKQLSHVVLQRGGLPAAMAQLRVVRLPIIGCGVAHLLWGPLCTLKGNAWDAEAFGAISQAIIDEYVRRRRLLLRMLPCPCSPQEGTGENIRTTWEALGLSRERGFKPYRTLRVDLAPSLEALRKQLDQKWRNQLNGAERNDLTIIEGTGDDLYQQFLALYSEMMARKNFETTVDPHQFRAIQSRLPETQKMLILISQRNGRPMTGLIGAVIGDTGVYLLGATSNEGMKTKGSYLLQWRMMQRLRERGCRWYDLGGVNPETNPGVYHFKQGMGGSEASCLGRFSLSADLLSVAAVTGAERLRSLWTRLRGQGA